MTGRLRVTILGMMSVVVGLALACAVLRSASDLWSSALYTFTVVVLLWAVIAARFGRGRERAFWFGFAVFGWGFFFLEMGPWKRPVAMGGFVGIAGPMSSGLNQELLTSRLVFFLVPYLRKGTDDPEAINKITANTIGIAHVLITLALALGGVVIAILMRRRRGTVTAGRTSKRVATLSILAALGLGISLGWPGRGAEPPISFFPPENVGEGDDKFNEFEVESCSELLVAMGEKPLWKRGRPDREATIYRLLWVPSFHHPLCVRIDRTESGTTLDAKVVEGQSGENPGRVAITRHISLGNEQWRTLERHLADAAFWEMPTKLEDGSLTIDGDRLTLEGTKGGAYHVVDTSDPDDAYVRLCRYMLDLTGLKIEVAWEQFHTSGEENSAPSSTRPAPPALNRSASGGMR